MRERACGDRDREPASRSASTCDRPRATSRAKASRSKRRRRGAADCGIGGDSPTAGRRRDGYDGGVTERRRPARVVVLLIVSVVVALVPFLVFLWLPDSAKKDAIVMGCAAFGVLVVEILVLVFAPKIVSPRRGRADDRATARFPG